MDYGGSVPEPLLPPQIALQNPILIGGYSYYAFPKLNKILVMIDNDGDENYQPMVIPTEGGFPQLAFNDKLLNFRVHSDLCDEDQNIVYLTAESRTESVKIAYQAHLGTGELIKLRESPWVGKVVTYNRDHSKVILLEKYTDGDHAIYQWQRDQTECQLLVGTPLENRKNSDEIPLNSVDYCQFIRNEGLLFYTSLFEDNFGLGYLKLNDAGVVHPVPISGAIHKSDGELAGLDHIKDDRFLVKYNIDGCSWLYEGTFNKDSLQVNLDNVICGQDMLASGVMEKKYYDKVDDRYVLSFSTETSPTQIYTVEGIKRQSIKSHTKERILGISQEFLSKGEDASFVSYDGIKIHAKIYLPSKDLNYSSPHPLVYYIHGGPHSQEKPDFSWFSMPLIQYLTLKGFAVFVPNVRGSSGYGLHYMKLVDKDWGGNDRLDHVYAMEKILPKDHRVDTKRTGIVGRSYGGYMTLLLAARHPKLWSAAVDMFGPYDLISFLDRIPATWKPYYNLILGNPENYQDRIFLSERSPDTYIDNILCPLLVIQGKNDPRVIAQESQDVVDHLRSIGKQVEYLLFKDEGHDVLKFNNKVTCYDKITSFFIKFLKP